MATRVFEGIKFFQKILKRTMGGTFLWNFIKIGLVVSEKKMFKEKDLVNTWTDRRTTDNGLWHKLAGLRPVELQTANNKKFWPWSDCTVWPGLILFAIPIWSVTVWWFTCYLKTRFPALSAFHAFTRAKSPVIASSMMKCLPLKSLDWNT